MHALGSVHHLMNNADETESSNGACVMCQCAMYLNPIGYFFYNQSGNVNIHIPSYSS